MAIITDPDDLNQATEVTINTSTRRILLSVAGNLSNDGVTNQALYSFLKEEWKTDPLLIPFPFPMVSITPEQFELVESWEYTNDTARKLVRFGGWRELGTDGTISRSYAGIVTLGTFEDAATDLAYYQQGNDPTDTGAATNFDFAGPVNEMVLILDNNVPADAATGFVMDATGRTLTRADGGNWATDGFLVGGQILIDNAEDAQNDGAFLIDTVGGGVDGALTLGTDADAGTGFSFIDGAGGNDQIQRFDGKSWIDEGYALGGNITVSSATTVGNDGSYDILAITDSLIDVATASLTADTADNTAVFGPLVTNAADTLMTGGVDNRNSLKLFLRVRDGDPNGKLYSQSDLPAAGFTAIDNKVFRFPLGNATDLKIAETDANIDALSPYTEIEIRYFDQDFNIDIDLVGTPRAFGIVVDVGTHSGVDGATSGAGSTLTSAEGTIPVDATYTAGTLIVHDGADAGTYTISGTPTATVVTITGTFPTGATNSSFSLQRATPVVATAEEIYEKVQRSLRQAADIDATDQVVTGLTADALLEFVGDSLRGGSAFPINPNGGGSGVTVVGFDANDTNRISFFDNGGTERFFPFVAAGTITFNANLVSDSAGEYWMFFEYTTRTSITDAGLDASFGTAAQAFLDSAGGNIPTVAQNDYVALAGWANAVNNGVWQVVDATPIATQIEIERISGETVITETPSVVVDFDENPINSADAILVDNNAGADIVGNISASSVGFDFDYDGNVQGGRTAATDADIILRAIGLETAQFVEVGGTITRNVGLVFSLVAALERNYSNP
jgi:hypothetical protein